MKKRLFLTGIICLILGAFITGCNRSQSLLDKAHESKLEHTIENIEALIQDVYVLEYGGYQPDKEAEALFRKEYTNKWMSLSDITSRDDNVAVAIKNRVISNEEILNKVLVYITVNDGSVSVETKLAE